MRDEMSRAYRNDSKANGSLTRLASIQPGVPGAELIDVADLAMNTNDPSPPEDVEQNGTQWNGGRVDVLTHPAFNRGSLLLPTCLLPLGSRLCPPG